MSVIPSLGKSSTFQKTKKESPLIYNEKADAENERKASATHPGGTRPAPAAAGAARPRARAAARGRRTARA